MKLDHFNSIRRGGRSIDASNVAKSLTVDTITKLKLFFNKKSSRPRKHTAYERVLLIRPMPTETMYYL